MFSTLGNDYILPCLVVLASLLLGGCAKSIVVDTEFPEPMLMALPLNVGVHYTEAFTDYRYTEELPNDVQWSFELGKANAKLFDGIFASLFDITSIVNHPDDAGPADTALDAVIVPAIEAFEFSLPRHSGSDQYAVWIRYNLHIYSPAGVLITKWPVSAYGQSDTRTFGTKTAMEAAVIQAMRDAAASIAMNFGDDPKIKEALLSDDDS